jgi:hypothetical protein
MEIKDNDVRSEKHSPEFDTNAINRAIEKASKDHSFINTAINSIREMRFPAYKKDLINQAKHVVTSTGADPDIVALFESLDGYIQYRDIYHVQKALEENSLVKKKTHQITDQTREQPTVRTRPTTSDGSIKEREAASKDEERKDYPEVPPSAMSNFTCNTCGKQFQNQNELIQHQRFEGTQNATTATDTNK